MGSAGLNNRSNGQQYLGVTEPISLGGPTEFDVVKTQELEKVYNLYFLLMGSFYVVKLMLFCGWFEWAACVHDQFLADVGLYESQEEAVSREEVLGRLDQVRWMCLWF